MVAGKQHGAIYIQQFWLINDDLSAKDTDGQAGNKF